MEICGTKPKPGSQLFQFFGQIDYSVVSKKKCPQLGLLIPISDLILISFSFEPSLYFIFKGNMAVTFPLPTRFA